MNFPLFLIPVIVGLATQLSKRLFNRRYLSYIKMQGIPLPRYGGMPSAHTAFAVSLMTVVWLAEGWYSASFAIATAATIFILDDALRMRMFLGRHGAALHRLISTLPKDERKEYPVLETQLGHKPKEVVVGAIIGFAASFVLFRLFGM